MTFIILQEIWQEMPEGVKKGIIINRCGTLRILSLSGAKMNIRRETFYLLIKV